MHTVVVFAECIYLQVDLLGVGGLGGQGSIDNLLEGEGKDGGDPHAARGAHLPQVFIKIIKVFRNRERLKNVLPL